jgi:hypothetical protein
MTLKMRITSASDVERLLEAADRALSSWFTYAPYLNFFRTDCGGRGPWQPPTFLTTS